MIPSIGNGFLPNREYLVADDSFLHTLLSYLLKLDSIKHEDNVTY